MKNCKISFLLLAVLICTQLQSAQAPVIPVQSWEAELEIKPNTIEQKIFELGLAKDYKAIEKLIMQINDFTVLKNILFLQFGMALFIADRISFDIAKTDSRAFDFPEQKYIPYFLKPEDSVKKKLAALSKRIRLQWLNRLQDQRLDFDELNSIEYLGFSLRTLTEFLAEIGYIYKDVPIETIPDLKMALIKNIPLLFEPFSIVKDSASSGDLQALRKARSHILWRTE